MLEGGDTGGEATDFELVGEAERIVGRLTFLATLAQLWKLAAVASFGSDLPAAEREPVLAGWLDQAMKNRQQLLDLLNAVYRYRIPPPRGTQESLVEYDRRRSVKEMLLEQIIATCVETGDAVRLIRVVMDRRSPAEGQEAWEEPAEAALKAVLRGDPQGVRKRLAAVDLDLQPADLAVRGPGPRRQSAADRRLAGPAGRAPPPAGLSAAAGPLAGNRATDLHDPGDGDQPSRRARGHHRVRPDVQDRLQGDRPQPGRRQRRMVRGGRVLAGRRRRVDRLPRTGHRSPAARLADPQPRRAAFGARGGQ